MLNWLTEALWHSRHSKHSRHSGTRTPETPKGLEHLKLSKGAWALRHSALEGHLGTRALKVLKALGHFWHHCSQKEKFTSFRYFYVLIRVKKDNFWELSGHYFLKSSIFSSRLVEWLLRGCFKSRMFFSYHYAP